MKTNAALLLIGVSLALASPAIAAQIQVGYSGSSFGPYQSGVGGEFTLNDINPEGWLDLSGYVAGKTRNFGGITSFQTFCIEKTEFIHGYNTTYNAQLSANAMYGSVPGTVGDPVSRGTGWLYSQFAQGGLAGYAYTGTTAARKASAELLQNALWWLEEEGPTYTSSNIFMLAAYNQFGGESGARANGGTTYGVYALNLWTGNDPKKNRAQDQLFKVPDGGTTLALLGMALFGMVVSRRFRRT